MVADTLAQCPTKVGMPFGFRTHGTTFRNANFEISADDGSPSKTVSVHGQISQNFDDKSVLHMDVTTSDITVRVEAQMSGDDRIKILINGIPTYVTYVRLDDDIYLFNGSHGGLLMPNLSYKVKEIIDRFDGSATGSSGAYTAPMPGKIIKVMVKEGEQVKEGQTMVIMEAMKMEHVIKANKDGVVESVSVQVDDFVDDSQVLCALEE